jgi:uncharacterized protein
MDLVTPQIIRRRVNIAFDPSRACGWHFTKAAIENLLNAISYTFPPGERFFIHSVQNYRDRITDPVLKEQVKDFVFQEAMHTKEHARCNVALTQAFPDGPKIERLATRLLTFFRRFTPKPFQLACTCALEHFTAILADTLLRGQELFLSETDPAYASLWLWHAVEESEHKAVCFDVYQAICGKGPLSYLRRVFAMFVTTVLFLCAVIYAVTLIRRDRKRAAARAANAAASRTAPDDRPREALQPDTASQAHLKRDNEPSLREIDQESAPAGRPVDEVAPEQRRDPGLLRGFFTIVPLKLYLDYYRPSFHPWDHDNRDLIVAWRQRYRSFGNPEPALS